MEEFTEISLDTLPDDVLEWIVLNMEPKAVANLCSTSMGFAEFCRIEGLWEILMKHHFPDFDLTDDPRKQFIALAEGNITRYKFVGEGGYLNGFGPLGFSNIATLAEEDYTGVTINIYGRPLPPGTQKWCVLSSFEDPVDNQYLSHFAAYSSREAALTAAIEVAIDVYNETWNDEYEYEPYEREGLNPVRIATLLTRPNASYIWWQNLPVEFHNPDDEEEDRNAESEQTYSCEVKLVTFQ